MSRSYKKFYGHCQYFFCTDQASSHKPKMKALFSRAFRRTSKNPFFEIGNHAFYKKWNCSFAIRDYVLVLNLRNIKKHRGRNFYIYKDKERLPIRELYKMVIK